LHSLQNKAGPAAISAIFADLSRDKPISRRPALDLYGGNVVAAGAAEHPDFRPMLNARQLAHELHRRVALLANRRLEGAGRRHEAKSD
jgi:hypothetical protein